MVVWPAVSLARWAIRMLPLRSLPTGLGPSACPIGGDEEASCVDSTGDVGEHEAGRVWPFLRDMGVLDVPCNVDRIRTAWPT
eukprot:15685733-Heterocapsa_arctica.AAC.1